jgi:hypothetical protein
MTSKPTNARLAAVSLGAGLLLLAQSASAQQTPPVGDAGGPPNTGTADDPPRPRQPEAEVDDTATDAGAADAAEGTSEEGASEEGSSEEGPRQGARAPAEDAAESREQPLTDEQRARMVPSEGELPDGNDRAPRRFFFPPYLREWGPNHDTTVVFPFFFNSRVRDTSWLLIPPYFRLRSPMANTDAVFPLFFRTTGSRADGSRYSTTVIPPVWVHQSRGPERARTLAYGAFPLFSYYENFGTTGRLEGEHLVIPALLTFHRWTRTSQQTITPLFQYVRDGSSTTWTAGPVVPLVARHTSPSERWTLIWPLLFFHRSNLVENRHLTVVGPFWTESAPNSLSVNFAPLFFHSHTRTDSRTTFFPLFHTESSREHFTLAMPLGGYIRVGGESTLVLPFYQNHRGTSEFDSVAPLFFYGRDRRMGTSTLQVLNFVHSTRPTGYSWGLFPLIGRFHEEGRYDTTITPLFGHSYDQTRRASTTWVFPNVHVERSPEHRVTNVYPLVYTAAGRGWHHNVFFPFVWDVGNRSEGRQTTVVAPFYAHVGDRTGFTRWAFPDVFWWQHGSGETLSWGYDIAPFFQYGEPRRGDYYWSVLYGLAGYRRQGSFEQTRVFWATIDNRRPDAPARPASTTARGTTPSRGVIVDL